ncbi:DUF2231 domain-containing protein [Sanguibacter sp. HDW7]|uniref:DUF2231 domain-containing protein n=1 Tax=Sanguibacter sp. HDW7 TaxID=2714931 RepID=UPI00140A96F9|nr:DUF2231 domain-containing protein [Sanguibacter sp. HDW7]QIK82286.1 DUF2231 domain-containing protein [Sanguibacter sp. HDW7]
MTAHPVLASLDRLETSRMLAPVADALRRASEAVTSDVRVRELLQGSHLGHPMHAALAMLPVGAWASSVLLAGPRHGAGARRLLRTAVLATPVVAVTGLADARRLDARRRRVAVVHVACNLVASTLGAAALARTSPGQHPGRVASLGGFAVLMAGGFLGGHLSARIGAPPPPRGAGAAEERPLGRLVSAQDDDDD